MNEQQQNDVIDALQSGHYEAANLIIHAVLNEDNHETVLGAITSAEHALELMRLDPINTQIILQNTRLRQLIQGNGDVSTTAPISFYKLAGRRPSFYADINQETGEVDLFRPKRLLGQGQHAHVRMFANARGTSIAVKTPLQQALGTSKESISNTMINYHNEYEISRRAYKNARTCQLFCDKKINALGEEKYELRSIMPHIHGEQVLTYLKRIQSPQELAQIILGITEALMRLHQAHIIHGDIKLDNIMITTHPRLEITFIDFGLAYLLTDETASIFPKDHNVNYLAPERFDYPRDIAPHTNQDVYSFAYNLRYYIIDTHPEGDELQLLYPSIANFAWDGQSLIPELRPTLESLHEALSNDIRVPTTRLQATEDAHGFGIH